MPSGRVARSPASADDALFRPVRAANAFEETVERLLQEVAVEPGQQADDERGAEEATEDGRRPGVVVRR